MRYLMHFISSRNENMVLFKVVIATLILCEIADGKPNADQPVSDSTSTTQTPIITVISSFSNPSNSDSFDALSYGLPSPGHLETRYAVHSNPESPHFHTPNYENFESPVDNHVQLTPSASHLHAVTSLAQAEVDHKQFSSQPASSQTQPSFVKSHQPNLVFKPTLIEGQFKRSTGFLNDGFMQQPYQQSMQYSQHTYQQPQYYQQQSQFFQQPHLQPNLHQNYQQSQAYPLNSVQNQLPEKFDSQNMHQNYQQPQTYAQQSLQNQQPKVDPQPETPMIMSSSGENGPDLNSLPQPMKEFIDMIPNILSMQDSQAIQPFEPQIQNSNYQNRYNKYRKPLVHKRHRDYMRKYYYM